MALEPSRDEKQPSERDYLGIDFSNRLAAADALASITECKCYEEDTGEDKTSEMIESPVIDGTFVKFWRQAGTDGKNYQLTVKVLTVAGAKLEADLFIVVREVHHA